MSVDQHDERIDLVRELLAETEAAIAMHTLARRIGESAELLGFGLYDALGEALGIDPNGLAALAIVTALVDSGRPEEAAGRMLAEMDKPEEWVK